SAGRRWTWEALSAAASETAAFRSVIDPDDARFAAPGLDMPERVRAWCREHGEPVPESDGAIARSILDGLALATAEAARRVTSVAGMELRRLAIVGGGAANIMLARLIAEAAGVPVVLGPTEATAIGNALVQHVALEGATGRDAARGVRRLAATVEGARTIEPSGAGRAEIEDARRRIDTVRTCENRTP
ncbi:MAG: FGGY-family carbohydrate kinase, partial [Phycisphaerales bacterium]